MEHPTVVISGTKIADEISSNRSEVWRLIQQVRGLGVDVAGHPATGYQLRSVPDLLLPEILHPLLRGTPFDSHLHHFYKIGSTNTTAMAAAAEGAPHGSIFCWPRPWRQFVAISSVDWHLLLGDLAAAIAAVRDPGALARRRAGRAVRDSA
jgi:biotin operon repressor